jgi:hypothetical protein
VSVQAGSALARARIVERGVWTAAALALLFELGVALLERAHGRTGAADRALGGGVFGFALPLFCYFLVSRVCAGDGTNGALHALSRHGADRRASLLGLTLPAMLVGAAFAAVSGVLVVLVTRGFGDASLGRDAFTSAWIGALAGPAYVVAFMGASAFGRLGRGRSWLLAADFVLGAGSSFWAFPWPKGHLRNLLGGVPVLEMSQLAALAALLGTSLAFLGLGALRTQR